jgi:glycosyltransferase involved in cell wall biosynthesis
MRETGKGASAVSGNLPRLLYWADLQVAASRGGPMLMHRLLQGWPAEKLMVATPDALSSCTLPGVRKVEPPKAPLRRLFRSRFAKPWMTALALAEMGRTRARGGGAPRWMRDEVKAFSPEAIVTAGVAGAWMGADALARSLGVPLHVVMHDDHHYSFFWIEALRERGEQLFGEVYRRAASRFCVSRPMEREYARRFGAEGEVLLPSRGPSSPFHTEPRHREASSSRGLKIFHAGSISGRSFPQVDAIAGALSTRGHRLILYTASKPSRGFQPRHLEFREFVPSEELVRILHDEADIILLYTDFSPESRKIVETLFPSKLVDYTAAGTPILAVAPEYACIADYLRGRPSAADVVTTNDPGEVVQRVEELAGDNERWHSFAAGAIAAGREDFSHEAAFTRFCSALTRLH